jgi:hypothetical protein
MPRFLLIVITTEVADGPLRDLVRSRAGDDAEMLVVAAASKISRLDWLTNAEDDARDEAASLATKTAEAAPTENVETSVGDSDPLKQSKMPCARSRPMKSSSSLAPTIKPAGWRRAPARLPRRASVFRSPASRWERTECSSNRTARELTSRGRRPSTQPNDPLPRDDGVAVHLRLPRTSAASGADAEALKDA